MFAVLLPPGGNPIAVNKYIISFFSEYLVKKLNITTKYRRITCSGDDIQNWDF